MIFTDLYKSPKSPLSRLRHSHAPNLAINAQNYDADLVSKDKAKMKDAVKRHLQAKVRTDWDFTWPPPDASNASSKTNGSGQDTSMSMNEDVASEDPESIAPAADDASSSDQNSGHEAGSETDSIYSTVSEDPVHYQARQEWSSELSEDELPYNSPSPFKFDSPDSIGKVLNASKIARRTKTRRELRKEAAWNDGLACFEARRNAWTGARTARVRPKLTSPTSPSSPRRGLFWRSHSHTASIGSQNAPSPTTTTPLSPITTNSQHSTHSHVDASPVPPKSPDSENSASHTSNNNLSPKASRTDSQQQHHDSQKQAPLPVETLLPIPPPLLPPANPMRASITPALYLSVYDKVIVHSLQPSCPINLADMVRASVAGWKRDGEWPPRPAEIPAAPVVAIRTRRKASPAHAGKGGHESAASGGQHPLPLSPTNPFGGGAVRRMSLGFLGRADKEEKEKGGETTARRESGEEGGTGPGKAIRRSLQKVLGLGHGAPGQHPSPAVASVLNGNDGNENVHA